MLISSTLVWRQLVQVCLPPNPNFKYTLSVCYKYLQVIWSQFVDETALPNIGNANHKQSAVWTLCSVPSTKSCWLNSNRAHRPVLSSYKFWHRWNDGGSLWAIEGLAVCEQHSRYVRALPHRLLPDCLLIWFRDQVSLVEDQDVRSRSSNNISKCEVPPTKRNSCIMNLHELSHKMMPKQKSGRIGELTSKTQSTSLIFLCMDLKPLCSKVVRKT